VLKLKDMANGKHHKVSAFQGQLESWSQLIHMYQHMGLEAELLLTQCEAFQCSRSESRLWLAAWSLNVCVLDPDFPLSISKGKIK